MKHKEVKLIEVINKNIQYKVPEFITVIGAACFIYSEFKEIYIPDNIKVLDSECFYGCNYLKSVKFSPSSNLEVIKDGVFKMCHNLDSINLPPRLGEIGEGAFYCCGRLKSVTIPTNVEIIDDDIFKNCHSLSEIKLHEDVFEIGKSAFQGCDSLVNIKLPNNIREIKENAFWGSGINSINYPTSLVYLGTAVFERARLENSIEITKLFFEELVKCTYIDFQVIEELSVELSLKNRVFINSSRILHKFKLYSLVMEDTDILKIGINKVLGRFKTTV